MLKNINKLISTFGPPDVIIDHWENKKVGYAIWGFEETIIWDKRGLYFCNNKIQQHHFEYIQSIFEKWKKKSEEFAAVGFISYDFKNFLYPHLNFKDCNNTLPYLFFGKPQKIVEFDIQNIIVNDKRFMKLKEDILPLSEYTKKINSIKKELESGNSYQINFTMPKKYKVTESALKIYMHLRNLVKPKFGFYFKKNDDYILSFSPERYFKKESNMIYSYPMKGTRKRSNNLNQDQKLKLELKKSAKDRAEHLMIIDLIRNDLGKISKIGSVKVENIFNIESHKTVHQMVSCVKGELKNKITEFDIIKALFPGGSITGAPKESSMKIIDKLEGYNRNLYTGTIGYIKNNGDMNFNMSIRTMMINKNDVIYPVGGGIVWDSEAQKEWDEAQIKSKILSKILI